MDNVQDNRPNPFPFPMLPIGNIPTSIPLVCNICPKQPSFSDTSHLLTHIASKAHLSTYYNLKVRSASEQAAQDLIEDYDTWYATWGIEDLMAARMNNKELRRKQKARRASSIVSTSVRDQTTAAFQDDDAHDTHEENGLTEESTIKHESHSHQTTPFHFQQAHIVNPFTTSPWLINSHGYEDPEHPPKRWREDRDDAMHLPTASAARQEQTGADEISFEPMADDEASEDSKVPEYARLKGVFWPGMDMFDSATPDMRRKRNQKKPVDVVERLEALSRDIEATEVVYSAEGVLQKARPITGFPHSSSSPMKNLSPSPKRQRQRERTRRKRKPLAAKDSNAPIKKSTNKGKRVRSRKAKVPADADDIAPVVNGYEHTNDHATDFQAFPALNTANFDYLNWALPFQHPEAEEEKLVGHFRPTISWPNYVSRTRSRSPRDSESTSAQSSAVAAEGSLLFAWDFLGQDGGISLVNPLFMGSTPVDTTQDDEDTISASPSER